jgi:methionyl-tRNA synthetase
MKTLLITPPPTPNGPLHVGHLSGPYIAGDIAARAARAAGRDVVTVCGLDSHQNYVLARATADGLAPADAVAKYGDLIRSALAAARVSYDLFLEPLGDGDYQRGVARMLDEMVERKAITVEETTLSECAGCGRVLHHVRVSGQCPVCGQGAGGGTCEGCGSFLCAADLADAISTCCGAPSEPRPASVPLLRMENFRGVLTEVWARAQAPRRVRTLFNRYLDEGLPEVPLAYPTDWGIPWTCDGGEYRIDVWAEMAFGYLYAIPRHLRGYSPASLAESLDGWTDIDEVWHFLGIDNAFYYGAMIPAILAAAGMPTGKLAGLVVNEFYRLDGLKFSTSRDHAIWAHEFLAEEEPSTVRAYLAWDRPDSTSTDFTLAGYQAFREVLGRVRGGGTAFAPQPLPAQEADRALAALALESFDPALAMRCVLSAPDQSAAALASIIGE